MNVAMLSPVDLAVERLRIDEGFRASAYKDTAGHTTIGFGFDIDAGISEYAALALLEAQTQERADLLKSFWWSAGLDDARLSVLIELAFNLGETGLLHFPKMLAAVGNQQWQAAHDELLDSDAARELPTRYQKLAQILLTGVLAG